MENKVENSVGNVVRHVIIDVLLVTTVVGVAAMCTNMNKVCNSASTMCYSISCTSDQFRSMLENLNNEFRPISARVYDILNRVDDMLDPEDTTSREGSISYKIKEILDRTNKYLDPNDFNSDPRSMGGKAKAILDNFRELSSKLVLLGNHIDDEGRIDPNVITGVDCRRTAASINHIAERGIVGMIPGFRKDAE